MQEPQKILQALGLADSEIQVYLAMLQGLRSPRDIMKMTRQKRPTVYYALSCLEKRGLLSKTGKEGSQRFEVEPLERLQTIAEEKTNETAKLAKEVESLIPLLEKKDATSDKRPKVAFFEGVEAVKNVIMGSIYCREKHIDTIVPHENFFWQVGKDFVEHYVEARVERRIKTRNLWEPSWKRLVDQSTIKRYYEGLSEIRILPAVMHGKFLTTIFLYDDKTLYVSSLKSGYCVQIVSQEHHDAMKALFEGLWENSKKLKNER